MCVYVCVHRTSFSRFRHRPDTQPFGHPDVRTPELIKCRGETGVEEVNVLLRLLTQSLRQTLGCHQDSADSPLPRPKVRVLGEGLGRWVVLGEKRDEQTILRHVLKGPWTAHHLF